MKSLKEFNKEKPLEKVWGMLKSSWYFETIFDKTVLIIMGLLAMWKITGWIF